MHLEYKSTMTIYMYFLHVWTIIGLNGFSTLSYFDTTAQVSNYENKNRS